MSISKSEASKQFNCAVANGWLAHFQKAAETTTKGYFDAADLLAIASRETNLDPKWLTKAGDGGNGYGLMQADLRSFKEWIKTGKWKIASQGIQKGAEILMQKWRDYEDNIGKTLTVKSSKGGTYKYKAEKADGADAQKLVISSYNCGRWSQYAFANDQDIDKYSTGGDYAADVMSRAKVFRQLLKNIAVSPSDPRLSPSLPTEPAEEPDENLLSAPTFGEQSNGGSGELLPTVVGSIEPVIPVQQAIPAKDDKPEESLLKQAEKTGTQLKSWYLSIPTFILTALGAFWERITSGETSLVYWLAGTAALIVIIAVAAIIIRKERADKRAHDLAVEQEQTKRQRETQAHELTLLAAKAAMSRDTNNIRFTPQPIQNSDSEAAA